MANERENYDYIDFNHPRVVAQANAIERMASHTATRRNLARRMSRLQRLVVYVNIGIYKFLRSLAPAHANFGRVFALSVAREQVIAEIKQDVGKR